ncbi:type II secretion system protein [Leptolyngbya cf. ectocarpi LEGE 11479]|uniref:Type II secretion system protein n=1 Tax=Leptolyngbya cf. ectocarpi LEGE 11479 TaxID=1828722 RepID=A0A928ZW86_LEPEC|nr:prepilin-type N-terminal cleavage/methylation domain-containing protein [Leptolyngbya ectocarpi]MBE9068596.1 type II secretion system protein [Leptolyngbya cf. ectocarpi LEGE 11479]
MRRRKLRETASSNQGFTLLELLVALIMSGVIFAGLMTIIVNFLQIDRREAKLDQLQQDTRRATDFMADDLREAIYVYGQAAADPDILDLGDLAPLVSAGSEPVLALWRPVPIEAVDELANIEDCATQYAGDADDIQECGILQARRATYSLVIYAYRENAAGEIWQGPARIERYELPKYADLGNAADPFALISASYVDPTDASNDSQFNNFEEWTPPTGLTLTSATLVDQIGLNYTTEDATITDGTFVSAGCPRIAGGAAGQYLAVPEDVTEDSSFYACVRDPAVVNASNPQGAIRASQDVYLFVQGDARSGGTVRGETKTLDASDSYLNGANESSKLPEIEARVLVGGGVNRDG